MPGKHKEPTISFRPNTWERAIIEQRAALSGMHKKDFISRSCVHSNIVIVGKRENIQRIVDELQEMQIVMKEIAGQIQSGDFTLSDEGYQELKRDYLALVVTVVDPNPFKSPIIIQHLEAYIFPFFSEKAVGKRKKRRGFL